MSSHQETKPLKRQRDPFDSMEEARTKMAKLLKESLSAVEATVEPDIKHSLELVRAILTVNSEIWERVKASYVRPIRNTTTSSKKANFRRRQFETVEATGSGRSVTFLLEVCAADEAFSVQELCTIPDNLAILQPQYLETPSGPTPFIDFEALLERSLLLHEDVLKTFLVALKIHLETVQVRLGDIERWLMEANTLTDYVNDSFNVSLDELVRTTSHGICTLGTYDIYGRLQFTFQISKESERTRLTKLLDFIQSPVE